MNNEPVPTVNVPNQIIKGSVVRYKDGWMEVRAKFKTHVNLGPIFHSKTTIKKVPLAEVYEDREAWYENWTKSDQYQCM